MFWLILVAAIVIATIFAYLMIRLRIGPGLICMIAPALTVLVLFFALRQNFSAIELGPFLWVPLLAAFLLATAVSVIVCRIAMERIDLPRKGSRSPVPQSDPRPR